MADLIPYEYGTLPKVKFVATMLPAFGVVGGLLRVNGWSDVAALTIVAPIFIGTFLVSVWWTQAAASHQALLSKEAVTFREREVKQQEARARVVAEQQEEAWRIRARQSAEQAQLLRDGGSKEQLARLMDRHRAEYEKLLERQKLA